MTAGALISGLMAPPRFTLTVPDTWIPLDLDPRTRTESIGRLVEQRLGADAPVEVRRELTATLRQYARQAAAGGALYAALMYQEVDGLPLSASLLVALAAAPPDPAGLGAVLGAGAVPFDTLAGPAVRAHQADEAGAQTQYAVRVPEGDDAVLTLTFATPNLALADPLGELFDAIARTLDWAGP
jgi:hypothetical protein